MNDNSDGTKKEWINLANVISCIAVLILHTNGCFWTFSKERYWYTANIIESVFYFAVPVFFMISGATLIDYRERYSTKEYFRKRIDKTLIPFIAWSLVGLAYKIALGVVQVSEINARYVWNGIVNTSIISIYWFFPVLFGIYLSIPLFAAVEKNLRKNVFAYAAVIGFGLGGVMPLICKTVLAGYSWNLNINVAAGYLLYVLVGYLISEYEIPPMNRVAVYILGVAGLLIHIIGTYHYSVEAGEVMRTVKGYTNAPCIMYSTAIFVLLKQCGNNLMRFKVVKSVVNWIDPYTMCIYLMQYFAYSSMVRAFGINTHSIIYRLGAPIIIIPVVITATRVMRKIPVMKRIVP